MVVSFSKCMIRSCPGQPIMFYSVAFRWQWSLESQKYVSFQKRANGWIFLHAKRTLYITRHLSKERQLYNFNLRSDQNWHNNGFEYFALYTTICLDVSMVQKKVLAKSASSKMIFPYKNMSVRVSPPVLSHPVPQRSHGTRKC